MRTSLHALGEPVPQRTRQSPSLPQATPSVLRRLTPLLTLKILGAGLFTASFTLAYVLLPLASLGFLPMFFVYASMWSPIVEELRG